VLRHQVGHHHEGRRQHHEGRSSSR
jgi:hypothetical protein